MDVTIGIDGDPLAGPSMKIQRANHARMVPAGRTSIRDAGTRRRRRRLSKSTIQFGHMLVTEISALGEIGQHQVDCQHARKGL